MLVPPMFGNWIQLNSNGTVKKDFGLTTIVRILHDKYDRWIIGFNRYVGICSILDVEL